MSDWRSNAPVPDPLPCVHGARGLCSDCIKADLVRAERRPLKLWLDDNRPAPEGWTWIKTADEAIAAIKACPRDLFEAMAFDHDLGHCGSCEGCNGWKDPCGCRCHLTGYVVAVWMETEDAWPKLRPTCHSRNPVGRSKIEAAIARKWDGRAGETR